MQISNKSLKIHYDLIDEINSIKEINEYIDILNHEIENYVFSDDLAGGIFMSSLLLYAKNRKIKIEQN